MVLDGFQELPIINLTRCINIFANIKFTFAVYIYIKNGAQTFPSSSAAFSELQFPPQTFQATCSGHTNPPQQNNTHSFTPKENFKAAAAF